MDETINSLLDGLPNIEGKQLYVFGTGNTARLYIEGLKRLERFAIEGYVNNNCTLGGGKSSMGREFIDRRN